MYSISTRLYYDELKRKLDRMSADVLAGQWTYDAHEIKYTPSEIDFATEIIASTVADIVQREAIKKFAYKYLKNNTELTAIEKKLIHEAFLKANYIHSEEGVSSISYYLLYLPIIEFLKSEHFIDIDGWLSFRMDKYYIILTDMMEQTIFDYRTQEDYNKVLEFLKDSRPSNSKGVLNLYCTRGGQIDIYNRELVNVTSRYVDKYCEDGDFVAATCEDFIIHILMKLSPENIVVHNTRDFNNLNFINTLKEIFQEQLHICTGCDLCDLRQ